MQDFSPAERSQIAGFSILLFSVAMPLFHLPSVGHVGLIGRPEGWLVLAAALAGLVSVLAGSRRYVKGFAGLVLLAALGCGSIFLAGDKAAFFRYYSGIAEVKGASLSWGWISILAGAALVGFAGGAKRTAAVDAA